MKGRVAVLKAYGGEFELREYPVPDPEPGAILIKLTRAGVCGSDLHIWRGEMKEIYGALPKDLTFGHEMCGKVERLGAGVTTDSMGRPLREGDRVTYCYFFPCGRCPVCLHDEMGSCPRKARPNRVAGTAPYFNNAYGDYYYLRAGHFIFKVPDEIPEDVATPINCALSQVLYGLRKAGFRAGQSLVVQGAGGLGLNAVAVARDMGADTIIVIDRLAERLALAKSFGADHTVNATEIASADKRVDAVKALTDGFGAHVVADFVGYADVIPEGLRMLRGGGGYLEVGSISPGNVFSYDATALVRANARLVATSNYSPWALEQSLSFMKRNLTRFPFEKVISHVFPLERISEAFAQGDWAQRGGDPAGVSRAAISM